MGNNILRHLSRFFGISIIAIAVLIPLAGCGYTSSSLLPADQDSIYVSNFVNKVDLSREISDRRNSYSYRPGLENDITRAIIDEFIHDRHLDLNPEDKAALLMKGSLTDFKQYPLSYEGNDTIAEFRMEISVDVALYDNRDGKLLWSETAFRGETSYTVSGPNRKTQSQAIAAAVKDLAKRIVERTVEHW